MLEEKDLDIQPYMGRRPGSGCSFMSIEMCRSSHTPRIRVADNRNVRSSISSRARQLKDHEGYPFLSVDLLCDASSHCRAATGPGSGPSKSLLREEKLPEHSTSHEGHTSVQSNRRNDDQSNNMYSPIVNKRRPASSFNPSDKIISQPNLRVKMPFKHAADRINYPATRQSFLVPGRALIEKTSLAVDAINNMFLEQKPAQIVYKRGRLLKARLKSLEPVPVTEPTIHQCRGILAETRVYSACSNRTIQRLRSLLSEAHTPISIPTRNLMSIHESVHMPSEASSPEPAYGGVCNPTHDIKSLTSRTNSGHSLWTNTEI